MVKMSYDVVKRWVNEAQEAASSDNIMVQVRLPVRAGGGWGLGDSQSELGGALGTGLDSPVSVDILE